MTQQVLIGVGGSGQHAVHAYLRLLTLTFPLARTVPHVFIIDADAVKGGGEEKRNPLIDNIFSLHGFLTSSDETPARCEMLSPMRVDRSRKPIATNLRQLLEVEGVPGLTSIAHGFLADDEGEWGSDWSIELSKGMMANPKVGSIAIAHKMEGATTASNGDTDTQLGSLLDLVRNGARIAIVGSNFGGTGSGVVPALVRQLERRPGVESIRAFMCLPWFSIDSSGAARQASAARAQDGVEPMVRNSSLGLHTYSSELAGRGHGDTDKLQRSSYVLVQSMSQWPIEKRKDDGNFDQSENRHVINLVLANAIQAFFGLGSDTTPAQHLYCIKTTAAGEALGQFDAGSSPHLRFWVEKDSSIQLDDLVADAEATAFVLEKSGRIFEKARKGKLELTGVDKLKDHAGIDRFLCAVAESLGKVPVQYGFLPSSKRRTAGDDVFASLGTAMLELATQIRRSLIWLDGHSTARSGGAKAGRQTTAVSGVNGTLTTHLFTAPEFGNTGQTLQYLDDERSLRGPWSTLDLTVVGNDSDLAKSPPVSQAIAIFNAVFNRQDETNRDPAGQLIANFSRERQVAAADSGPAVAARVLGRSIHRYVRDARRSRHTESASDDRQFSSEVEQGAGIAMLNLSRGITAAPVRDCRLAEIDLDQPLVGIQVDPFSAEHPKSLAYLDPYSGLRVDNGGTISLAVSALPEHGLRGIPNIAAPELLQRWRLQCRPETDEERSGPAFLNLEGRARATRAGIYLHARRVNEAALWLIISGDPRVTFVDDLLSAQGNEESFSRLLRGELRISPTQRLQALVLSGKGEDAGKPLFLWSGETWYLAANTAARRFFGALVKELPSVRYRYRADNPIERRPEPNLGAVKALDGFFAMQLQHAVQTIDNKLVTKQVLDDIVRELPPSAVQYDPSYLGIPASLWLRSSTPSNLVVAPHRAASALQEFFCDPRVVFVDSSRDALWNGVLPMRAEVWRMLEGRGDEQELILSNPPSKKVDERSLALRRVSRMRLKVAGLGVLEQDVPFGVSPLPMIQDELSWEFGIWPNFKAENWDYYIISGTSRLGDPDNKRKAVNLNVDVDWMREGMDVALVVKGRRRGRGEFVELGRVVNGLARRILGVPEVLELVVGGRVLGSRRIDLERREGQKFAKLIGVDFGTSNTCLAVQFNEAPSSRYDIPLLPGGEFANSAVENLFLYMDSSRQEGGELSFLTNAASFFQVKNATVAKDSADTIPSELLVCLDNRDVIAANQRKLVSRIYQKADGALAELGPQPTDVLFGDYPVAVPLLTPLPPRPNGFNTDEEFRGWLRAMVDPKDQRVKGNLKWPGNTDDASIRISRAMRAVYIEQTVVAAFAVLRANGFNAFGSFVTMQPEALSEVRNTFADTFFSDVNSLIEKLSAVTGIRAEGMLLNGSPVRLVSESVAALHAAGDPHADSPVSILTIDIGGGTTDVGVCLRKPQSPEARYTASARFAGNSLLEALAQSRGVRELYGGAADAGDTQDGASIDAMTSMLKSELRRSNGKHIGTEVTAILAEMFMDGIFEYAFKVLASFIQVTPGWLDQFTVSRNQTLEVLLLGNGFRLYEAFQPPGERKTLAQYCEQMRVRLAEAGLVPQAVVQRLSFRPPESTKSGLIRNGGFEAAITNDLYDLTDSVHKVLLPAGLVSMGRGVSERKPLADPALVKLDAFRVEWLGIAQADLPPARELSLRLEDSDYERQFPLTFRHWTSGRRSHVNDLHAVFRVKQQFAAAFMDVGALYLAGIPRLGTSKSFVWLMVQYAIESSRGAR